MELRRFLLVSAAIAVAALANVNLAFRLGTDVFAPGAFAVVYLASLALIIFSPKALRPIVYAMIAIGLILLAMLIVAGPFVPVGAINLLLLILIASLAFMSEGKA